MSLVPFVHLDVPLADRRAGARIELSSDDRHHLGTVLRLRRGADVEVADGVGTRATAVLLDGEVELTGDAVVDAPPHPTLTLAQALPKGRKFDEVVRQTTELGVDRIVPVAARRSQATIAGDRAAKVLGRWRAVARAASEQARRSRVPVVDAPVTAARLPDLQPEARVLVAHPGGAPLPACLEPGGDVVLAIGPEGGWDDEEIATFLTAGGVLVGLGRSVLRTEHAGAAAVAVAAAVLGRWDPTTS